MQSNYWHERWCIEVAPTPGIIVLFGAAGDLAKRKLYPSLFLLYRRGLLHDLSRIIGCARSERSDEEFRKEVLETLPPGNNKEKQEFLSRIRYVSGDYNKPETYSNLKKVIAEVESKDDEWPLNHLFYLAIPASTYTAVIANLSDAEFFVEPEDKPVWRNVVLEKPFGYDTDSAEKLDRELHKYLKESQIYRIDHYLGKETVQNISMFRFANILFEPVWNHNYIDHVQITTSEEIGVEHRANYYEKAGHVRDMFQNHMLEMLSLAAMEVPTTFAADAVRDEKLKLIEAIRPFDLSEKNREFIRAQYISGNDMIGYRDEPGVAPDSQTETFFAAKFYIDNWRWKNVPFYMRSGKRMSSRKSEIVITFKQIPHSIFYPIKSSEMTPNTLVLKVQPDEGIELTVQAKQPGPKLCMGDMTLNYNYQDILGGDNLDAYARLLLDAFLGDQTLFIRSDHIAASWRLFSPILDDWKNNPERSPLYTYKAGTDGPDESGRLLFKDNREWRDLSF